MPFLKMPVAGALSPNDNSLLLIDYLVENGGEVFAETGFLYVRGSRLSGDGRRYAG